MSTRQISQIISKPQESLLCEDNKLDIEHILGQEHVQTQASHMEVTT
jgi:hypothetical protein